MKQSKTQLSSDIRSIQMTWTILIVHTFAASAKRDSISNSCLRIRSRNLSDARVKRRCQYRWTRTRCSIAAKTTSNLRLLKFKSCSQVRPLKILLLGKVLQINSHITLQIKLWLRNLMLRRTISSISTKSSNQTVKTVQALKRNTFNSPQLH